MWRAIGFAAILGTLLFALGGWQNVATATHAMPCYDIDGDGVVTQSDVDIVASYFHQEPLFPPAVDVTQDGIIRVNDELAVYQAIGTTTSCQDTPVNGHGDFGSQGDDLMPSMGKFRIVVEPQFRPLMSGYPDYDGVSRLDSPTLFDSATKVGRSAVHLHGSAADTGGTPVGTAGTMISDTMFPLIPPGFEAAAGAREVHTELRTMDLALGPVHVRAGTAAPSRPISPGEVESHSTSGLPGADWPAESFFDVFVEIDLPALGGFPGGTLYNPTALLVHNAKLVSFPPKVVYIHENHSAVPIVFKTTNAGFWQAGDLFGYLVLAGHGANFANNSSDIQLFEGTVAAIEQTQGEMPVPAAVGGIALDAAAAKGASDVGLGALAAIAGAIATVAGGGVIFAYRRTRR